MIERILVEGALWKLKTSFTGAKTWKECYVSVVLKESTMREDNNNIAVYLYQWTENYKPSLMSKRRPKHTMELSQCSMTYYTLRQYSFVVTSQSTKDTMIFACNDQATYDAWLAVIDNYTWKVSDVVYKSPSRATKSFDDDGRSDGTVSSIDQNFSVMSNILRRNKSKSTKLAVSTNESKSSAKGSSVQGSLRGSVFETKESISVDDQHSQKRSLSVASTSSPVTSRGHAHTVDMMTVDDDDGDELRDLMTHFDAKGVFHYFCGNNLMAKVRDWLIGWC